jgi:hypothetical protein
MSNMEAGYDVCSRESRYYGDMIQEVDSQRQLRGEGGGVVALTTIHNAIRQQVG